MSSTTNRVEKLEFTTKLAFGAGDVGTALSANLLIFFLLPFFTNVAGLSPSLAGSILMIGKISDAINDPIIGVSSDRTSTPWGRRIPWMILGAIPFVVCFFLMWVVPQFSDNPTTNNIFLFIYYMVVAIAFHIFYTSVNLPYQALTPELTKDYNERTSLNSFRFSFSIGASIFSLILAGIIFDIYDGQDQEKYLILGFLSSLIALVALLWCPLQLQERGKKPLLNRQKRKQLGFILILIASILTIFAVINFVNDANAQSDFIGIILLLFTILLSAMAWTFIKGKTENHLLTTEQINLKTEEQIPFFRQLKIVFSNKPFLFVIGIYLCSWLAVQLTASILLFFVVNWMGLPEASFPQVAIAVQGTALVMLFVWQQISRKLDKKIVYFLGSSIWIIAQIGLFLIQPGQTTLLYFLAILAGFGVSVAYLIPWSMIPDVIDLDELNTGKRREGIFYGFMVLLQKLGLALGLFLVGIALDASGFIRNVPGEAVPTQPSSALLAIRLVVSVLPAVVLIMGVILAYFYPITREYHSQIRLKLSEAKNK
ncbi:major facilitator superfamily MFS_1 [Cyanobacterium stanieri PCC 7202]|uniref:Major facilitator superfamily MFS_1 n=1 Tax=Cyanobacterium stanieri (strain ATCC 29140 / PCC 7202) TaxID=292563 RepID=K9YKB1_CYASC|nr:major facilitator superfamily MFS_1 [Cyanobacterium stanieri PCC 7202]